MNSAKAYQNKLDRAMTDHQNIDGETELSLLEKAVTDAKVLSETEIKAASEKLETAKQGTDENSILEAETALDDCKKLHEGKILEAETALSDYMVANKIPKVIK